MRLIRGGFGRALRMAMNPFPGTEAPPNCNTLGCRVTSIQVAFLVFLSHNETIKWKCRYSELQYECFVRVHSLKRNKYTTMTGSVINVYCIQIDT